MDRKFAQTLFDKQIPLQGRYFVNRSNVVDFIDGLLEILYPHYSKKSIDTVDDLILRMRQNETLLNEILLGSLSHADALRVSAEIFDELETISILLDKDLDAVFKGDPAAKSIDEVLVCYPGFFAIYVHRVAHALHNKKVKIIPRIFSEYAHQLTGIDIHPGANIGEYFCIDHGTGIVIGETTQIGKHVKVYQGVTLGALSVDKNLSDTKRHPTIGDNCTIYSSATILGGETVIGENSIVGGNVWLTKSVQPNSIVYHKSEVKLLEKK
ncbi:MAG: serine acetyltransferase [Bacteriovoracaceae bacterium]|nr:serine acetyltransferase [Bacteriovoracaceae bacterium]